MSEAYSGTTYISDDSDNTLAEFSERNVHDVGYETSGYVDINNNNLYEIMKESDYKVASNKKAESRKRLIPGDIYFKPAVWDAKKEKYIKGYHVAMIQSINIVNGNRAVEVDYIKLIESTHDNAIRDAFGNIGLWGVGNRNNLGHYHKNATKKNWIIGRIKSDDED